MNFSLTADLDLLTEQVRLYMGVTGAIVTQITARNQIIVASSGLSLPDHIGQVMPLEYSICQHVVAMDFPLVVDDALTHPLLPGCKAISELGVYAYLGSPIHRRDGTVSGAFCVVNARRRRWSGEDLTVVNTAARRAQDILQSQE